MPPDETGPPDRCPRRRTADGARRWLRAGRAVSRGRGHGRGADRQRGRSGGGLLQPGRNGVSARAGCAGRGERAAQRRERPDAGRSDRQWHRHGRHADRLRDQRLGPHFAVGVGVFSNFAEHLEYPAGWAGRHSGTFLDLTTTTINPSVAIRPIPRIAIGFGFDIVPSSLDLRHDITAGSSHSATTAVGLGGNVGLLIRAVPRYLQIGASYRSAVDLDLAGTGVIAVAGGALEQQEAKLTVPLPHNFAFGLGSRPANGLTLTADARLALWSDLHNLTISYTDPAAGMGAMETKDTLALNQRDSYGFRLGGEYRLIDERLRVRLGVGFDTSPVRRGWLQPFTPDSSRVAVGAGLGYHYGLCGFDVGYSAQIVLSRTSSNPDPGSATYSALRHVISIALEVRLDELGGRINVPEYKN